MATIIDAHQHFWRLARGDYGWNTPDLAIHRDFLPDDFRALPGAEDVAATVLVQAAPTVAETEYMLGLADATPFIAGVVGWIDFTDPADRRHLERLRRHPKFLGVRPMIQDIPDPDWMLRADIQWAFDAVRELDLAFDALGYPVHLDNFARLFARHPALRIVIDHCAKPRIRDGAFEDWAQGIARLARESGAVCKLSGLATEAAPGWTARDLAPYAAHVLAAFGPERVMWGSDWPVLTLAGSYADWLAAARGFVAPADHDPVFAGTARAFYRLAA